MAPERRHSDADIPATQGMKTTTATTMRDRERCASAPAQLEISHLPSSTPSSDVDKMPRSSRDVDSLSDDGSYSPPSSFSDDSSEWDSLSLDTAEIPSIRDVRTPYDHHGAIKKAKQPVPSPSTSSSWLRCFFVASLVGLTAFYLGFILADTAPDDAACDLTPTTATPPCALFLDMNRLLVLPSGDHMLPHRRFFPIEDRIDESKAEFFFSRALDSRVRSGRQEIETLEKDLLVLKAAASPSWYDEETGIPNLRRVADNTLIQDATLEVHEAAKAWLEEIHLSKRQLLYRVVEECRYWSRYGQRLPGFRAITASHREAKLTTLRSQYAQLHLLETTLSCWLKGEEQLQKEWDSFRKVVQLESLSKEMIGRWDEFRAAVGEEDVQLVDPKNLKLKDLYKELMRLLEFTWRPTAVEKQCADEALQKDFGHCFAATPSMLSTPMSRVWEEWHNRIDINLLDTEQAREESQWARYLETPRQRLARQEKTWKMDGGGLAVRLMGSTQMSPGLVKDLEAMKSVGDPKEVVERLRRVNEGVWGKIVKDAEGVVVKEDGKAGIGE